MKAIHIFILSLFLICSCGANSSSFENSPHECSVDSAMPVTGTFLNLVYQDVRNKYTNPPAVDYTDPMLWHAKVDEMKKMGMEYLVLMAVANEGRSFYPSQLMPPACRQRNFHSSR